MFQRHKTILDVDVAGRCQQELKATMATSKLMAEVTPTSNLIKEHGIFCTKCNVAVYCSYKCRRLHWSESHAGRCWCVAHVLELVGLGINKLNLSDVWSAKVEFPDPVVREPL